MLLFSILFSFVVWAKKQKDFEFELKEGKSIDVPLKLEKEYVVLYVRPDNAKDELGEILFKSGKDETKIIGYYETAIFNTKDVNLKCVIEPCKGHITIVSVDPIEITTSLSTLTLTQKQPIQLVSMQLPKSYNRMVGEFKLQDDEFDKIKIEVFDNKTLLYGDEVQMTIGVNKKDCDQCKIFAVLSGDMEIKEEAQITAQLLLYKETQSIELDQDIQDYLFERDENNYKLQLPSQFNLLQIGVFGNKLPLIKIYNKDQEYLNTKEPIQLFGQGYHIYLRKGDINTNDIFINLSQAGPLKYLLNFKLLDEPILYNNQFILSPIQENQKHTYSYKTAYSEQEIGIDLKYVNKCDNLLKVGECNRQCELQSEDTHNLRFKQNDLNPIVYITPECSSKDDKGFCRFQLEITSSVNNLYLLSTTNEKNLRIIKSNTQYSNYLEQSQQEHLIIKYQKQDDDEELVFTVNTHNIVYMISKNNNCFPVKIECAKHYGGLDHLVILRGKQLQHSQFYITLTARETSFFQFMAKVTKRSEIDVKIMKEDETYRGVLKLDNGESKIHYFRVMVNLQKYDENIQQIEDSQPAFEFAIHSSRMQVALTLNVGNSLPSLENYKLVTFNNYLSIQPEDSNYIQQGNYTIGIQNVFETFKDKEILYTFTYSTSRTVKTLHIGQQFIDQVRGQKTKYFSFYFSQNTTIFFITLSGIKSEKLSLTVQNEILNKSQNIYQKGEHSSTLKLDQQQLQKLCLDGIQQDNDEDEGVDSAICQAYILVQNKGNENILFNINIWNPTAAIELKDGQQYSFNLEYLISETFLYYKVIADNTDVQINIHSHYGYTRYSIEILNINGTVSLFAQEEYKTQHSKSIYSSAFEFCGSNCVIKIMLQGKQINYSNVNRDVDFDDSVQITVSQQYMDIQNGIPIQIQVTDVKPRKFLFHDIESISPQSRFKLILHEIYGKGSICLSFSDEDYLNDVTCDYEVLGNVVELTQAQINEKFSSLNLTQNPFIIIKIYSLVSSSKFQLQLQITSNVNDHKLIMGIPTRVKLDIKEEQTYQYFNIQNNDELYFKFIKIQGTAQIEISRCLNESKIECNEEIIMEEQLLAGQSYNQHIIQKNDNKKYCELCSYLIKIKTIGINLDMLIVITSQQNFVQLPQNLAFIDYLEGQNDYNLYHFSYDTDHQIEIQINQYNGNTQMWIGYSAQLNEQQYQYGPYNVKKQMVLMNTTNNISYYQAILPPREHIKSLNITPFINSSHTLAGHYNDDDIYIIVKNNNNQQSNYSIQVTQSTTGNGLLLQDGVITNAYLSKQTPNITLYHQYKYDKQPHLFIKVTTYGNLNNLQYDQYFKVEVSNETQPTNYTTIVAHSILNNQINYLLPIMEGILTIKIHSLLEIQQNYFNNIEYQFNSNGEVVPMPILTPRIYQFSHNYLNRIDLQISIVGKELFMINQDSNQIDQIYDGVSKYYESYIQNESKLAIQVYNCLGDLSVAITQNYDELMNMKFTSSKTTQEGQLNDLILTVKPGPIYFQFESQKSVYKFTTKTYQQNEITPYGKLILGGDGQINYSFETYDPDIITIKFKPIKCIGCDLHQESNSIIKYYINWGSNLEYSHIIGLCQYNIYTTLNSKQEQHFGQIDIGNYYLNETLPIVKNITVDKQSLHNQLFISIRAQLLIFGDKPIGDYELYYHIAEIALPKNAFFMYKHMFIEFLLSLGVLALFILSMLCCLCSFYRKSRQLKLQNLNLQLEKKMEEVKTQVKYDQMSEDVENNDQS